MNKFIKPMLKKYEGLAFAQKVQARYVLYFCLVNLGINLAILLGQVLTNSFGEFFLVSLSVGIVSWVLFFIFLGGGITVVVPLIILGLIFVFSFQTLAVSAPLAISIFQYLGYTLTVLVLVALLSNRLILFTIVGAFASLFTVFLVIKSALENNQILKDPNFVTPIVTYYIITGFVIFALVNVKRLAASAMAFSDKKAKESSTRLERLTAAAQLAGENSDIGEKLAQSTSRTQDELKRLEEKIQSLTISVQSVAQSVNQMETSSKGIAESNEDVRTKIERQKTLVDSSGAAIEQMVASIASVSQISESRRAPLQKLLDTTRLGSEEMKKAMDAMKNIEKSSSGVMDLVKIILGVAAQTNLLAMNAAIEAAHAGEAGAGFAVVASEIRKLSESTRINTKSITDYLKANQQQVKDAVAINERAGVSFERIEQEIRTITSAIEEILNSMSELAHAGNEVLISVSELQQGTSLIVDSSNIASKELSKQKDEIPVVMRAVRSAQNDVEVVEEGLKTVMNESAEIESLGSSSRTELEKLKKGLGDIQGGKS